MISISKINLSKHAKIINALINGEFAVELIEL